MVSDINKVILIGRMTSDIEIRTISNGQTVGKFSLAVNRKYGDKEEVSFFSCQAWGKLCDIIRQYAGKGKRVAIDGRLRQNRWKDQTGAARSMVEIVIEGLQLLGDNKSNNDNLSQSESENFDGDNEIPF